MASEKIKGDHQMDSDDDCLRKGKQESGIKKGEGLQKDKTNSLASSAIDVVSRILSSLAFLLGAEEMEGTDKRDQSSRIETRKGHRRWMMKTESKKQRNES